VVVLLRYEERPIVRALRRFVSEERAARIGRSLVQGLVSLRHPAIALRALALTLGSWLVLACSAWLLLLGFDLGVGFGAGLLVTIATTLVLVIPAAPGGVGQFETAAIVALSAFGVGSSRALSFGIVFHVLNLLPYVVAGYVALRRHAVVVGRRRREEGAEAPAKTG
jgi:uncharacterized protein (TIRG00374 family)